MKKIEPKIIGQTEDGKPVVMIHLSRLADTHGLPMWATIDELNKRGLQISWIHEYNLALWYGWSHELFMKKLEDELMDDKEIILEKLRKYILQKEEPTPFNHSILIETREYNDN